MSAPPIVFATDFGAGTEWVGICHAVIASIAPESRVIDLTHELPQFHAAGAGMILRDALPFTPRCVGLFVVDPGVGTPRRRVAIRTGRGDVLVGPDNGLLTSAAQGAGGVAEARELTSSAIVLPTTSTTFHARDVFAPAAAHLSAGYAFEDVGTAIDVGGLALAPAPALSVSSGRILCEVADIDVFGNVRLSARRDALAGAGLGDERVVWVLAPDGEFSAHRALTYGEVEPGRVGMIVDSFGWLCLCANRGSAAEKIGAVLGSRIEVTARP